MKVITIGRDPSNDKVVSDPCASRHHLQIIQHDDGHFTLSDFGSTNGTYVNGQKISGEIPLKDTDIVRIGNTTIPWRMYFEDTDISQGNSQPQTGNVETSVPATKNRHGFVTFWLWFGIVASIINIPLNFISISKLSNLGYLGLQLKEAGIDISSFSESIDSHQIIWIITTVLLGICLIVCYSLLLKWKKNGFWGFIGVSVTSAIINLNMLNLVKQDYLLIGLRLEQSPIPQVVMAIVSIVILWAVLQIKKEGVSCWKQLE